MGDFKYAIIEKVRLMLPFLPLPPPWDPENDDYKTKDHMGSQKQGQIFVGRAHRIGAKDRVGRACYPV